ncbi:hypothetical protein NDU88_009756 [Pleurodeles waltl]|uniref:Uncharacterized protein n=1 Tax=Pleurodeles waltl TaxID=8319 RepID=A0AAV7PWW2_PLEWA|nr:hypothetical protein NDU88_009756 [Pleurodeles waltl]
MAKWKRYPLGQCEVSVLEPLREFVTCTNGSLRIAGFALRFFKAYSYVELPKNGALLSARPVPFWPRLFLSNSGCYRNPIFFPGRGAAERPGRLPNHTCSLERGNGRPRRSACRPLLIPAHGG